MKVFIFLCLNSYFYAMVFFLCLKSYFYVMGFIFLCLKSYFMSWCILLAGTKSYFQDPRSKNERRKGDSVRAASTSLPQQYRSVGVHLSTCYVRMGNMLKMETLETSSAELLKES